jgi:fructose 1,6-bisphosphatase
MRTTICLINADVGSIGGHVAPSQELIESVRGTVSDEIGGLLNDAYVTTTPRRRPKSADKDSQVLRCCPTAS